MFCLRVKHISFTNQWVFIEKISREYECQTAPYIKGIVNLLLFTTKKQKTSQYVKLYHFTHCEVLNNSD
jgi:hypothetical protein